MNMHMRIEYLFELIRAGIEAKHGTAFGSYRVTNVTIIDRSASVDIEPKSEFIDGEFGPMSVSPRIDEG